MTDIVERLRGWSGQGSPVSSTDIYTMTQEAADEIERLREQVAALQASSGYEASIAQVEIERLRSRFEKLQAVAFSRAAEIERLRAALADTSHARTCATLRQGMAYGPCDCGRRAVEPKP